jgi:hypothetical protein
MEFVSGVAAIKRGFDPRALDPEEVARRVRQLAVDAHRILNHPDTTVEELIALRRRFKELLRAGRGSQPTEIERWLRSAQQEVDAKLLSGPRGGSDPSAS